MRRYFAEELKSSGNFNEVNLEVSFRSTAAILDTVNCVFADEEAKRVWLWRVRALFIRRLVSAKAEEWSYGR